MLPSRDKRKKKVKELFSKYVSEEAIEKTLEGKDVKDQLKKGNIDYLIMQIRGDTIEDILRLLSKSTEIIVNMNGMVSCIFSSLLFATFGFPFDEYRDASGTCEQVVNDLVSQLKKDIRVVYGSSNGLYGNLGSPRSMHFGPLLPRIEEKLKILFTLGFAESRHIE